MSATTPSDSWGGLAVSASSATATMRAATAERRPQTGLPGDVAAPRAPPPPRRQAPVKDDWDDDDSSEEEAEDDPQRVWEAA